MLSKLLKHEFRATARLFMPLFVGLLVCSLFVRVLSSFNFDNQIISLVFGLFMFIFVVIIMAVGLSGQVISIYRLYKSVFTDEGYLTNTLPVKTSTILNSKLIIGVFWTFVSYISLLFAAFIILFNNTNLDIMNYQVTDILKSLFGYISNYPVCIALIVIILIVSSVFNILIFYASFALGNMFNTKRVLISLVFYFVFSNILSIVLLAVLMIMENFVTFNTISENYLVMVFSMISVILAVLSVGLYALTHHTMAKKLNLQ